MASITIVLATYNEETNIRACMDSIASLADEICIVDGNSTDKTVEIVREFGAKVKVTDNLPMFHINKQKAIDMASSDWILQLDADERVTKQLAQEIRSIINSNPRENGFWIPRKNWFLGRYLMKGGQYPDYTLRLYRRGKGKLPQIDVHEQAEVDGEIGYLKEALVHIADPKFKRYLLRFNRYTSLSAKQLNDSKISYNLSSAIKYLVLSPIWWFLLTYGRHKGFMDGWQGLIFSIFSSLRFPVSYIKGFMNK